MTDPLMAAGLAACIAMPGTVGVTDGTSWHEWAFSGPRGADCTRIQAAVAKQSDPEAEERRKRERDNRAIDEALKRIAE